MRMLLIDNYDSFTYNLVQLFQGEGVEVIVRRNDEIGLDGIRSIEANCLCISPGPGVPADSGISREAVRSLGGRIPVLGVCLGMQVINEIHGGRTARAPQPVHGKRSAIRHNGTGLFAGVPNPCAVARYHSLCVDVAEDLRVDAETYDGVIMAFSHRSLPIYGVQFHPESFMSEHGRRIAANFLTRVREQAVSLTGGES